MAGTPTESSKTNRVILTQLAGFFFKEFNEVVVFKQKKTDWCFDVILPPNVGSCKSPANKKHLTPQTQYGFAPGMGCLPYGA